MALPLAWVTGASSGIGLAVAQRLLRDGWRVLGLSRRQAPLEHAQYSHLSIDLAQPALLESALAPLLDGVDGAAGLPRAVVHAAGLMNVAPLGAPHAQAAATMWSLHVDVGARLAHLVLPRMMAAREGRLVLIGSRVSGGMPGRSDYAASKAAMVAQARSWAAEVVAHGVTVNLVSPAATDTRMAMDPARTRSASPVATPPIGRLIRADEVAAAVAFLLSDDAAAITGQELMMCGGASLNR